MQDADRTNKSQAGGRLPNFLFPKRMCTDKLYRSGRLFDVSAQFYHNDTSQSNRKCQSLGKNSMDCYGNETYHNSNTDIPATSNLSRNLLTPISRGVTSEYSWEEDGDFDYIANDTRRHSSPCEVPMPPSLRKIFAKPFDRPTSDIQPNSKCTFYGRLQSSRNCSESNRTNLNTPYTFDKERRRLENAFHSHSLDSPKTIPQNDKSNVSSMSSSSSFPFLMELFERRESTSAAGSPRSSLIKRERRHSDSDGSSSMRSSAHPSDTSMPGENWYYYDVRMRPGESLQVASTLLEFFSQLGPPAEPIRPPSYDSTVAIDLHQPTSTSSEESSLDTILNLPTEDGHACTVSESDDRYDDSPPPYSESAQPPAYEEIDEREYQNIYELININDFLALPSFSSCVRSRFNFRLTGRPAVRWNVQSGVDNWATASSFGWNRL